MNVRRSFHVVIPVLAVLALSACARKATQAPPASASAAPSDRAPAPSTASDPVPPAPSADSFASDRLSPVFFDFDSWTLREETRRTLDANARLLREHTGAALTIEGHCDERGTEEYNLALGERRAAAARDYLVAAGIARERLEILSLGKERPFALGSNEEAWAKNRRAHFVVR